MASTPAKRPTGQRFSHVYVARGEPTPDSQRMRRRIASLMGTMPELQDKHEFHQFVEAQLGIQVTCADQDDWTTALSRWDLADVLDVVTITYQFLLAKTKFGMNKSNAAAQWNSEVERVFREENVHYTVDPHGGVHLKFDDEFARNSAATIAALQTARYANTLEFYQKSMAALSHAQPDGKSAIRAIFAAIEGLFRLIFPSSPRLTSKDVLLLLPLLQQMLGADRTALAASARLLKALQDWIEAAHLYRHDPEGEEPAQPPLQTIVALISVGSANLRWLAEIDAWWLANGS